ncbi:MAG: DUF6057 family protein, partial [Bacteroidales bacterium]
STWLFLALFFALSFIYFYKFGNYILFFQEQQSLFVYLPDFYRDFLIKPGGLLDLAGRFITQFYIDNFTGSLILALVLTLPGIVMHFLNSRLEAGTVLSPFLTILPSCVLLLMQSHYYHIMAYNLGFLMVLLYFLLVLKVRKKSAHLTLISLYPVFYYITGAYALLFAGLYAIYSLVYEKGLQKIYSSVYVIILSAVTILISANFIFLQPLKQLLTWPLPSVSSAMHRFITVLLSVYVVLYPLFGMISGLRKTGRNTFKMVRIVLPSILLISACYTLYYKYNPGVARVINLEKLVFEEEWDKAVVYHEIYPSKNLIGQYFYNIALTETDQLCDRMFAGGQDFGVKSLFLPWDDEHLNWGSYVFYAIGLVNEAHRWAYEEMVVYGLRPQNLKMLVKTNIINGNLRIAEKYINILKKTLFYRKWAEEYEKLMDGTAGVSLNPLLRSKAEIIPEDDFFIFLESPEENLPLLVESNPGNRKAFEYLMGWLLLNKDIETIVKNIPFMKELGYDRLPVHIEEAVMIYYNSRGEMPDLAGFNVSIATRERFSRYVSAYSGLRRKNALKKENLQPDFGNTYWFFYHFL